MDYLQRLHAEMVPVAERLEHAQQRWRVTRLKSVELGVIRGGRRSGMKLSRLQKLMDVLANRRELVENTHDAMYGDR